jgi:hypothetical protein
MATNVQSTRSSSRSSDLAGVETTPTPVVTPTGVGGVAVYDQDVDSKTKSSLHTSPNASIVDDLPPAEVRSSGSLLTWIISAVVLILLVYFLLQFVF